MTLATDPNIRDLIQRLADALHKAEAALSDIGDAEREPDDDVQWCEDRAFIALPITRAALAEARAYLAAPDEPAVPDNRESTDEEILALSGKYFTYRGDSMGDRFIPISIGPLFDLSRQMVAFARAVLARWGNRTLEPIPLTERLPTEADCDAEGRCWWWHPESYERNACWCYSRGSGVESLWLPYWAFPIPNKVSDD